MKRIPNTKRKLQPIWEGPYYIVKINPNHSYRIRRCTDHVELKSSIQTNRLKLYKDPRDFRPLELPRDRVQFDRQQRPQNCNNQPRDADVQRTNRETPRKTNMSQSKRQNEFYEVEKLLKSKYMKNKRFYLVKWKDGSEPTWEPSNNVSQFLKQMYLADVTKRRRREGINTNSITIKIRLRKRKKEHTYMSHKRE